MFPEGAFASIEATKEGPPGPADPQANAVLYQCLRAAEVVKTRRRPRKKAKAIMAAINLLITGLQEYMYVESRARLMSCLGKQYLEAFQLAPEEVQIDQAVDLSQLSIDIIKDSPDYESPDLGSLLGYLHENLGACYRLRYIRAGSNKTDVDKAVQAFEKAVSFYEKCHNGVTAQLLNWLGASHLFRYDTTWSKNDIDDAIRQLERSMSVDLTPAEPEYLREACYNNLAIAYRLKFERSRTKAHLDRAVEYSRKATIHTSNNYSKSPTALCTYAACLLCQYEEYQIGGLNTIERLARPIMDAMHALPHYDMRRVGLASTYTEIYAFLLMEDRPSRYLRRSLPRVIKALNKPLQKSAIQFTARQNLNVLLGVLSAFRDGRNSPALMRLFKDFVMSSAVSAVYRVRIAQLAAWIRPDWKERSWFLEEAVNLLAKSTSRTLCQLDRQFVIGEMSMSGTSVASMAAAASLHANQGLEHALKVLEIGRGVLADKLLETRADVFDLELCTPDGPKLAKRFVALREKLNEQMNDPRGTSYLAASKEFDEVVNKIRALPGHGNFLLPPTEDELREAAGTGTIVLVNVSPFRCDAFIIRAKKKLFSLKLEKLKHKDIQKMVTDWEERKCSLDSILSWLWDTVAGPVLDELGFKEWNEGDWPRLWWIPTGLMSRFPLHAAGWHQQGRSHTVLDRVVSSYAASIRALLRSRRLTNQTHKLPHQDTPLLVHAPYATHIPELNLSFAPLRWAEREIDTIEPFISSPYGERISSPEKSAILAKLEKCSSFHFAGHGWTDVSDPSRSCLVLGRDVLTVNDLMQARLHDKDIYFAYLSACSTSQNRATNLQDESLHLVNAFQISGIPHVVGTLWEIDDAFSVRAAQEVYRVKHECTGPRDDVVALAVHSAARYLRQETRARQLPPDYATRPGGDAQIWAAYIHVGP